ncbi:hypothetical protein A1O3_06969 [Capronia epimyces CBS 606.96]|uniref:Uncharacterized protein n=1 Tax=Capronia epimyces CBS 606.96 TaxID=1182542 RepID=W9XTL3_9EURO|nr:uncharacterized protein A1O3_06969 [Capronia epimyces CBS 606.96]EXJ80685.1 hypothetical protein A1O3_06969 [Capronia epimyces CBS 606.96]
MRLDKRPGVDLEDPAPRKIPRQEDDYMETKKRNGSQRERPSHASTQSDGLSENLQAMNDQFQVNIRVDTMTKSLIKDPRPLKASDLVTGEILKSFGSPGQPQGDGVTVTYKQPLAWTYDIKWLESMDAFASCDDAPEETIGSCHAELIRRNDIRKSFYRSMLGPFEEITLLAFDLFDKYGKLNNDYKHHEIKKGSGLWKRRLDEGDILLIEDVRVQEPYRYRGIGQKMIRALMAAASEKTVGGRFVAIVWPNSLKDFWFLDTMKAIVEREKGAGNFPYEDALSIQWFRLLGFKRIGSSIWFGLPWEGTQPSPGFQAGGDYDPPHRTVAAHQRLPEWLVGSLTGPPRDNFVSLMRRHSLQIPFGSKEWLATDEDGNTLLHLAALRFSLNGLTWILESEVGSQMEQMRNSVGDTPLEALLLKLEARRTRKMSRSWDIRAVKFEGHDIKAVKCVAKLKGLPLDTCTDVDLARISYGCTCGECIEGFLSPRMSYALWTQAESIHNSVSAGFSSDVESLSRLERIYQSRALSLPTLPSYCRKQLMRYKSMRRGLVHLCWCLVNCLRFRQPLNEYTIYPAIERTPRHLRIATRNFFVGLGSLEAVVLAIFQAAVDNDEFTGNGEFLKQVAGKKDYEDLPHCRNDHEFNLVFCKVFRDWDVSHKLKF